MSLSIQLLGCLVAFILNFNYSENFTTFLNGQLAEIPYVDPLPEDWHGTWSGKILVHSIDGNSFEREMEISITKIENSESYVWKIVSEFNGKTTIRDYQLIPNPDVEGHFRIDEKNGIFLDLWRAGNTLYTYFMDGDILITGRYELRPEGVHLELASIETKNPNITNFAGTEFKIESYRLGSVQAGILKKITNP